MDAFIAYLSRTWRVVARRPAFAIPAIAGLAIGIGASTAVFSAFSAMELESMGFHDPAHLAAIWLNDPAHGQSQVELSYGDWRSWRGRAGAQVALASSVNLDFTLQFDGMPEHVDGTTVTGNFFEVLGAKPLAGRFLTDQDDRPGSPLNVVISYRLFRTRFGGDYGVIGRQVRFSTSTATVVGIARPEFDFPREVAVWAPLHPIWPDVEKSAWIGVFRSVARLAPGQSDAAVRTQLDAALRQDESRPQDSPALPTTVKPIRDEAYGAARPAVLILMAAVFLLLLIACANAANLILAFHVERTGELAVRAALGAGRWQIVGLLVAESMVTALIGGLAGLALARAAIGAFVRFAPPEMPGVDRITLNWPVALFGLALTACTVLLFSFVPAMLASRADPNLALQGGGVRMTGGKFQHRLRYFLIATEVALSVMLVIGAGLLVRSFSNLTAVDPGCRPQQVLTFRITTELADQQARRQMYSQVLERLRALPGVDSAGAVLLRPLSGAVGWDTTYFAEGQSLSDGKSNPNGNYEAVSPDYFRTLRIPLLAGRDFDSNDVPATAGVVIVNQTAARRLWPDGAAVGKRLRLGGSPKAPWLTVVGVTEDVRYREWESARPDFYVPYTQRAQHRSDFVVRTRLTDPWALANSVRQVVFAIDKNQPISNLTTMEVLVDQALARARLTAVLLSAVTCCAAGLAAIGIYGLLSYTVGQRTREIGVRTALGATPRQVATAITVDIARFAGAGLAIGLAAAAATAIVLRSQLFGVSGLDPMTYGIAVAGLLFLGGLASAIPAWRASSIDPSAALRQ